MKPYHIFAIALVLCAFVKRAHAQCPLNIDFGLGNFTNWQCYRGSTGSSGNNNVITVSPTSPTANVHQIVPKGTLKDPYGGFLTSPPGGGGYSVKLGNDGTGAEAERISYQFTVPATQKNFVISYQYAVVLQDPGHVASNQPRFTAKVFDITDNAYVSCGSFDYVATASLPGFKQGSNLVLYKDWTAVSINLNGYQGHQMLLEFTTADCTQGGHFGYAYVDVSSDCASLITGTNYCPGDASMMLSGPGSFADYKWYNADRSKLLGTGSTLALTPPPADGTQILLDLIPYTGFGCPYTATATITRWPLINLKVTNPAPVCNPATVDITAAAITAGSDAGLTYTYWQDAACTVPLNAPKAIAANGTFYIKGTSATGCTAVQPVNVTIGQLPVLQVTDPGTACPGTSVDLTNPSIVAGSSANLTFTYWMDAAASQALGTPGQINSAGKFYIKAANVSGCVLIKPVNVTFYNLPVLKISNPAAVCYPATVDLTSAAITAGSDNGLTFTYWADANLTVPLPNPDKIGLSGTYYIKVQNSNGCITSGAVSVIVNPLPKLLIQDPVPVCYPLTVDITAQALTTGSDAGLTYSYWQDAAATTSLANAAAIAQSGVYYIKAAAATGCYVIAPVNVTVNALPVLTVTDPPTACPSTTVDITAPAVSAGSSSNLVLSYWADATATQAITSPNKINTAGTYYIKAVNSSGCISIKPVNVSFYPLPILQVTQPAAVCFPNTVDITAPGITTGIDHDLVFSWWKDAGLTVPLTSPDKVSGSGTYYVLAQNSHGCTTSAAINVTVNPLPNLVITNPPDLCYPLNADITAAAVSQGSSNVASLTYWRDAAATITLPNPTAIADSGVYYIKAQSQAGCETVSPVAVNIHNRPVLVVHDPAMVYIPNTVDIANPAVTAGSSPKLSFTYWTDKQASTLVFDASAISQTGTYYIKATNQYGCDTIKPVKVTIAMIPNILVPTAFTPGQAANGRLYPFLVGVKTLASFKIYNRWGALVFQTSNADPTKGWDGTYKGKVPFLETFTWYAQGYDYLGKEIHRSGNTILLK